MPVFFLSLSFTASHMISHFVVSWEMMQKKLILELPSPPLPPPPPPMLPFLSSVYFLDRRSHCQLALRQYKGTRQNRAMGNTFAYLEDFSGLQLGFRSCWLAYNFGPNWNISATIGLNAVAFGAGVYVCFMVNCNICATIRSKSNSPTQFYYVQ